MLVQATRPSKAIAASGMNVFVFFMWDIPPNFPMNCSGVFRSNGACVMGMYGKRFEPLNPRLLIERLVVDVVD